MWRATGAFVTGTSHVKLNRPCQDYCAYERTLLGSSPVLIIAIADGAGSARLSQVGARASVDHLLRSIPSQLDNILELNEQVARDWFGRTRQHLEEVALEQGCPVHDLACTMLFAVLGEAASFFAQIGDGGWVAQKHGEYIAPTWPRGGEYANETTFLTSADWSVALDCHMLYGKVAAVAGFTDGLQRLTLQMSSRTVFIPFFEPLFAALRTTEDETTLVSPLIQFLSSERVGERTDDDKTLVLACWIEPLFLADAS